MIKLFNPPNTGSISLSDFDNLLHGKIVREFEEKFADYVGGRYAVSFNSATSALICLLEYLHETKCLDTGIVIPSIIPPVVPNAIITALSKYRECNWPVWFNDDIDWVGGSYVLHKKSDYTIIDSAHEVKWREFDNTDIVIYSFYPTKVVGSCDGGMIVSNNKTLVDDLRIYSMNGMTSAVNSWERKQIMIGGKVYMNSLQAEIATRSLGWLPKKKERLQQIRQKYNEAFELKNTSEHLYRIQVANNHKFVQAAAHDRYPIQCGIHYEAAHHNALFKQTQLCLPLSAAVANTTVSIPYNELLTNTQVNYIIDFVLKNKDL